MKSSATPPMSPGLQRYKAMVEDLATVRGKPHLIGEEMPICRRMDDLLINLSPEERRWLLYDVLLSPPDFYTWAVEDDDMLVDESTHPVPKWPAEDQ